MSGISQIFEYNHHALAIEWSNPDMELLAREYKNYAHQHDFTPEVVIFSEPQFNVETARQVRAALSRKRSNHEGALIIVSAQTFLREAQNILLKHVEEPTRGVRIIIITPSLSSLLETILSRAICCTASDFIITQNADKESFFQLPMKDRLTHVASILEDESKKAHIDFLEHLERELDLMLTEDKHLRSGSVTLGHKILNAKRLILSGTTTSKYLLEEIALIFPQT